MEGHLLCAPQMSVMLVVRSQRDPFERLRLVADSPWQILKTNVSCKSYERKYSTVNYVAAKGSIPVSDKVKLSNKRKFIDRRLSG